MSPFLSSADPRQNIILILLDTHRADRLGFYGYTRGTSPNLDEFARGGTVFERAVAPAQWTIPSHASMFTGLPPTTHLTTQASSVLDDRFPTVAELLARAGYETTGFCNNPLVGLIHNNLKRGFQNFYNYSGTTPNIPRDFPESSIFPFVRLSEAVQKTLHRVVDPIQNKFATSNQFLQAATHPLVVPLWTRFVRFKGNTAQSIRHTAQYLARKASTPQNQPFFLFLNLMETHLPFMPPWEYAHRFAPYLREERRAAEFMRRFNTLAMQWLIPLKEPFAEFQARTLSDLYDAEVAYQDHLLGELLVELQKPAIRDNSLVILTADHGEMLGEHRFMGHGFGVYRDLVQVPLVMSGPGARTGARVAGPVSTTRLFHTALALAGIPRATAPNGEESEVAPWSLLNEAGGRPSSARPVVVSEAYAPLDAVKMMERFEPELIEPLHTRAVHRALYAADLKLYDIEETERRFTTHDDAAIDPAGREDALIRDLAAFVKAGQAGRPEGWSPAKADLSDPAIEQRLRDLGYMA